MDVWDSPDSFQRFAEAQVPADAAQEMGAIQPRFLRLHNRLRRRTPART